MNLFETLWGGIEWLDHGSGWLEAIFYAMILIAAFLVARAWAKR